MSNHTIINSPEFTTIMLIYAMRSPIFMEKAASRVDLKDFNPVTEKHIILGMAICVDFWKTYKECIATRDNFIVQLTERVRQDPSFLTQQEQERLVSLVINAYAMNEKSLQPKYILEQFQLFIYDRRIRPLAASVSSAAPAELDALVEDMQLIKKQTAISTGRVLNLFEPGKELFSMAPRMPTGVNFFDYLMGGGVAMGDVIGLLGPFGKGKTTLAVQLACEFARTREYAAYLSYETDITPGVSSRMYGYIGGLRRADIQGKSLHEIDPNKLEALRREEESWAREYLLPVDMKQGSQNAGSGGAEEVHALLRDLRDSGKHVRFVILDQYLPMVNRYMAARNMNTTDTRLVMQHMVQDFMDIAQPSEMDCAFLLLHQTSTIKVAASPTKQPEAGDSAECKAWPWWMTSCLGLGTTDNSDRQWCTLIKGRELALNSCVVELQGDRYRYGWDHLNPTRFRAGNGQFIDTMTDTEDNIIEPYDRTDGSTPTTSTQDGDVLM